MRSARRLWSLGLLALLGACSQEPAIPAVATFSADAYPERLSAWGLARWEGSRLVLNPDLEPYEIATPLFTDYALKLRATWMPPDTAARYAPEEAFDFPVGTIVSKTFYYPKSLDAGLVFVGDPGPAATRDIDTSAFRLMETRLLVRQADGWDALPYVWRGDDAYLSIAGDLTPLTLEHPDGEREALAYIVPTRNECAACHATNHTSGALLPIGLKARHLNRAGAVGNGNQLVDMAADGRLTGLPGLDGVSRNAGWQDQEASLDARARAYLDANCGHCHNPEGAADTSGLLLDAATTSSRALGVCKPPIAAGRGTGGFAHSIEPGDPARSIMVYRLQTRDPGARMPELGRSLVHREGVALIRAWIASLGGECLAASAD